MQNYFLDGTKIEANANKYTFVWNKAVGNYDRKLDEKIKNHLREIDRIVAEENEIYLEDDLEETGVNSRITTGQVEGVVKSIDKKLAKNPMDKKLKKKRRNSKKISFQENKNMKRPLLYLKDATVIPKQTMMPPSCV